MAETQAAEAKAPTAAEVEALVAQARGEGFSAAAEIVDLCAIAGEPAMAAEFITARKPVAEVRAALLDARVEKEKKSTNGKELSTGVIPGADAAADKQGKPSPWSEVMQKLGLKKKEAK